MKKYFRFLCYIARLIRPGEFKTITFWRHYENKFLYVCMSEEHITDGKKFLELFSKAIRISTFEFSLIYYFYPDIEIVTVADDKIHSELQHEESEDQKLIQEP
jgi:hypothetical protein